MQTTYSKRSPAVKRLMKEAQELKEPTEQYFAQPLDDNLFEWHFTVRGPPDSDFAGGVYHGRIILPPDYPMKPPSIMLLTPTGRFDVGTKICLSISGHHPETWQPSWSIRTALLAIIGFMPTKGEGAIGSLDYTSDERKVLARKSRDWKCETCGTPNHSILPAVTSSSADVQREAAQLATQIQFKKEEKKPETNATSEGPAPPAAPANNPVPGPLPPNPLNMWNQQPGMMPHQPPFAPLPPNFMIPGQGQFGVANRNPQTPVNRALNGQSGSGSSQQPLAPPTNKSADERDGNSPVANQNDASQPNSQSSPSSGNSNVGGARQRTSAASTTRTNTSRTSTQRTAPPSTPPPVDWGAQGLLLPLLTMSIFSFIIIVLIFRRLYITYEYKFT